MSGLDLPTLEELAFAEVPALIQLAKDVTTALESKFAALQRVNAAVDAIDTAADVERKAKFGA